MARNYNIHPRTLPQVPSLLSVEGSWPGPIALSAGWFRARARPWNESVLDPMVRLDRGGTEFLDAVTQRLIADTGATRVYSPALYAGSSRVWRRSGYEDYASLDIMERSLNSNRAASPSPTVQVETEPDWDQILEVDRLAFDGFWGMSRLGLTEAFATNRETGLLTTSNERRVAGYAIVGSQWGTVYLHRIAVRPDETGQGHGAALLGASMEWGRRSGGRSMVLNVRPENGRARRLYEHHGFTNTGTTLQVLHHGDQ